MKALTQVLVFFTFITVNLNGQITIDLNSRSNSADLYQRVEEVWTSGKTLTIDVNEKSFAGLKRKKYLYDYEKSQIFYFERKEGFDKTSILISENETILYAWSAVECSKVTIDSSGYREQEFSPRRSNSNSDRIIEVGYSYDQWTEITYGAALEGALYSVTNDVSIMYVNNGVLMESYNPVKIMVSGGTLANSSNARAWLSSIWRNQICLEIDAAHHITTYDGAQLGHSGGTNMCNKGNSDFATSFSRHPNSANGFAEDVIAHELGHNIGASHEDDALYCQNGQQTFWMCTDGANELDNIYDYQLSATATANILQAIEQYDCTDEYNTSECDFCTLQVDLMNDDGDIPSLANGIYGLRIPITDKSCSEESFKNGHFTFTASGGCSTESRTVRLILDKYQIGSAYLADVEFTSIPEGFTLISETNSQIEYEGVVSSPMNEESHYKFEYVLNRISGVNFPTSYGDVQYPRTTIDISYYTPAGQLYGQHQVRFEADFWYAKIDDTSVHFNQALAEKFGVSELTMRYATCGIIEFDNPLRFILDVDGEFSLRSVVCFKQGSKLYFTPSSKFSLIDIGGITIADLSAEGATFDVCGAKKWQGIEALTPASIDISDSQILNADIGIKCIGSENLRIVNSSFINNHIGIEMDQYESENFMLSGFEDNTFKADNNYLPEVNFSEGTAYAGIIARDIPLVVVSGGSFENLDNGIIANGSSSIVAGASFNNIGRGSDNNIIWNSVNGNGIYQEGFATVGIFYNNRFNDTYRSVGVKNANSISVLNEINSGKIGIDVYGSINRISRILDNSINVDRAGIQMQYNSPASEAVISGNSIDVDDAGSYGILVREFIEAHDYQITDNPQIVIPVDGKGISIQGGGQNLLQNNRIIAAADDKILIGSIGIELLGTTANVICDNNVQMPTSANESVQTKGIFLSAGSDNHLSCNYTSGATYGINTWGFTDSQIRNNTFSGNYTGLYYGLYPSEGNVNTGPQEYMRNVWKNGTFVNGLYGAEHLNPTPQIVALSQYLVDDSDQPFTIDYDTPENAVSEWIFNVSGSNDTNITCDNDICDSNPSLAFTFGGQSSTNPTFAFSIANGLVDLSSNYNDEQNWIANYHLYNILERKEERGEYVHSGLGNFTNAVSNEILSLGEINELATAALAESSSISSASNSMLQEVEYILDNYENLSQQDHDSKLNLIGSYNSQLQALFSKHNADKVTNIQSIINNLPSRNNTTSSYYADAYEQALNLIADNLIDIQKLNSLASMCPIEAGEAVYLARQILKILGQSNMYDDISACDRPDSAPRASSNENTGQVVNSYPNPTSGIIRIDAKENIVAVSVSGATNSFVKVELRDNYIDISNYLPGVYLVKIEMQSGDIIFDKIVLVK